MKKRRPNSPLSDPFPFGEEALSAAQLQCVTEMAFRAGEVYVFYRDESPDHNELPLWGMVEQATDNSLLLESSSLNFKHFRMWHTLPEEYRYCRETTRSELRDYIFMLACEECRLGSMPLSIPPPVESHSAPTSSE